MHSWSVTHNPKVTYKNLEKKKKEAADTTNGTTELQILELLDM